ncbi:insertion element transposase [Neisseria gonorrhoeae FA6140]|nr:insertion element transposase [Neisseria gonorrhoeae FA6140]
MFIRIVRSYDVSDCKRIWPFPYQSRHTFCRTAKPYQRNWELLESGKRHLRKFDGIPKEHFGLYLKECGRRFDNSGVKVRISILKQLVKQDLSRLAGILKNKYIL